LLYSTFGTDEAGAADFVEAANFHGFAGESRPIVEKFNSQSQMALAHAGAY
jgi:hypothetical protein